MLNGRPTWLLKFPRTGRTVQLSGQYGVYHLARRGLPDTARNGHDSAGHATAVPTCQFVQRLQGIVDLQAPASWPWLYVLSDDGAGGSAREGFLGKGRSVESCSGQSQE